MKISLLYDINLFVLGREGHCLAYFLKRDHKNKNVSFNAFELKID